MRYRIRLVSGLRISESTHSSLFPEPRLPGVENGLGIIKDYERLPAKVGEVGEEMSTRGWKLVATDESAVFTEP